MSWNRAFTIALVEKNVQEIAQLLEQLPAFSDMDEARCAQSLIQEALTLMQEEKELTYAAMQKLKRTRAFVASAAIIPTHKKEYRG
jgi:chromosomal replication initiation ATPase DnaA